MNFLTTILFILVILLISYGYTRLIYEPYSEYVYLKKIHKDTLNRHNNWQKLHDKKYRIHRHIL